MIHQVLLLFLVALTIVVTSFVSCQEINNDRNNNKRQRYHKIDTISTNTKVTQEQQQQQLRLPSSDVVKDTTTSSSSSSSYAELIMSQLQEHSSSSTNTDIMKADDRDLQLNIGTIVQIVDTACDLVGELMLLDGTANCDCSLSLQLKFGCTFVQDICTGNFCTIPQVNGTFDLLQTKVTFSYCSNDGTFNDKPLPNFCVAVSGNLVAPSNVLNRIRNTNSTKRSSILGKRQFLNKISVTVDGVPCKSSSICNNGQGYVFDCTNINNQLIQTTCTTIQTITNLYQTPGSIKFLPNLDILPKQQAIPIPVPVPTPIPVPVPTSSPSTTFSYLFNTLFQQLLFQQQKQNATSPTKSP